MRRFFITDNATYVAPVGGRVAKWTVRDRLRCEAWVSSFDTRREAREFARDMNARAGDFAANEDPTLYVRPPGGVS